MSRRVECWDMEGYLPGRIIELSDQEAAAAIAAGKAKGWTRCRFKVSIPRYKVNAGEIRGLYDEEALELSKLDLLEILPWEPDSEPGAESKGLERPPANRMIRTATTKEVP
jgi:hypothetical protein